MAERRVCVAVDPSEPSQAALRWAAKAIVRRGDELRLFTVVPPSVRSEIARSGHFQGTIYPPIEAEEAEVESARAFLGQCAEEAQAQGVKAGQIQTQPVVADTGSDARGIGRAISRYAEDCGCETLVMGSRGLGLPKRALLGLMGVGSVSDYVVHHSNCNMVIHKDRKAAQAAAQAAAASAREP